MIINNIILAGGCFWCVEKDLTVLNGVQSVVSGYTGGSKDDAYYQAVCANQTQHREAVEVTFDERVICYEDVLREFILNIDPTDDEGQFADRGHQYQPVIYCNDKEMNSRSLTVLKEFTYLYDAPLTIAIEPRTTFYPAESYHQNYASKNPDHYQQYRIGSGREVFTTSCKLKYKNSKNIPE